MGRERGRKMEGGKERGKKRWAKRREREREKKNERKWKREIEKEGRTKHVSIHKYEISKHNPSRNSYTNYKKIKFFA